MNPIGSAVNRELENNLTLDEPEDFLHIPLNGLYPLENGHTLSFLEQKSHFLNFIRLYIENKENPDIAALIKAQQSFIQECDDYSLSNDPDLPFDLAHAELIPIIKALHEGIFNCLVTTPAKTLSHKEQKLFLPLKIACRLRDFLKENDTRKNSNSFKIAIQTCFLLPPFIRDDVWNVISHLFQNQQLDIDSPIDRIIKRLTLDKAISFRAMHQLLATFGMLTSDPLILEKDFILLKENDKNQYIIPFSFKHPIDLAIEWKTHSLIDCDEELKLLHSLFPFNILSTRQHTLKPLYQSQKLEHKKLTVAATDLLEHAQPAAIYLGYRLFFLDVEIKTSVPILDPICLLTRLTRIFAPVNGQNSAYGKTELSPLIQSLRVLLKNHIYQKVLDTFLANLNSGSDPTIAYLQALAGVKEMNQSPQLRSVLWSTWSGSPPRAATQAHIQWLGMAPKVIEHTNPKEAGEVIKKLDKLYKMGLLSPEISISLFIAMASRCQKEEDAEIVFKNLLSLLNSPLLSLSDFDLSKQNFNALLTILHLSSSKTRNKMAVFLMGLPESCCTQGQLSDCIIETCRSLYQDCFYDALILWKKSEDRFSFRKLKEKAPDLKLIVELTRKLGESSEAEIFAHIETFTDWLAIIGEYASMLLSGDERNLLQIRAHEVLLFKTTISEETPNYWKLALKASDFPFSHRLALLIELTGIAFKKGYIDEAVEWLNLLLEMKLGEESIRPYQSHLERAIRLFMEQKRWKEAKRLAELSPCLMENESRGRVLANLYEFCGDASDWYHHVCREPHLLNDPSFVEASRAFAQRALEAVIPQTTSEYLPKLLSFFKSYHIHSTNLWEPLLKIVRTKQHEISLIYFLQSNFHPRELFSGESNAACKLYLIVLKIFHQYPSDVSDGWLSSISLADYSSVPSFDKCLIQLCQCLLAKAALKSSIKAYRPIFLNQVMNLLKEMKSSKNLMEARKVLSVGFVQCASSCSDLKVNEEGCRFLGEILTGHDRSKIPLVAASMPPLFKNYKHISNSVLMPIIKGLEACAIDNLDYWQCAQNLIMNQHPAIAVSFFKMGLQRMHKSSKIFRRSIKEDANFIAHLLAEFHSSRAIYDDIEVLGCLFLKSAEIHLEKSRLLFFRLAFFKRAMTAYLSINPPEKDPAVRANRMIEAVQFYVKTLKTIPKEQILDLESLQLALTAAPILLANNREDIFSPYQAVMLEMSNDLYERLTAPSKEDETIDPQFKVIPVQILLQETISTYKAIQKSGLKQDIKQEWYDRTALWLENLLRCEIATSLTRSTLLWKFAFELMGCEDHESFYNHIRKIERLLNTSQNHHGFVNYEDLSIKLHLICHSNFPTVKSMSATNLISACSSLIGTESPYAVTHGLALLVSHRNLLESAPSDNLSRFFLRLFSLAAENRLGIDLSIFILKTCGGILSGNPQEAILGYNPNEFSKEARYYINEWLNALMITSTKAIKGPNGDHQKIASLLEFGMNVAHKAYGQQIYQHDMQSWLISLKKLLEPIILLRNHNLSLMSFDLIQMLVMNESAKEQKDEDYHRAKLQLVAEWFLNQCSILKGNETKFYMIEMIGVRLLKSPHIHLFPELMVKIKKAMQGGDNDAAPS